jgi:hypothetical protein
MALRPKRCARRLLEQVGVGSTALRTAPRVTWHIGMILENSQRCEDDDAAVGGEGWGRARRRGGGVYTGGVERRTQRSRQRSVSAAVTRQRNVRRTADCDES